MTCTQRQGAAVADIMTIPTPPLGDRSYLVTDGHLRRRPAQPAHRRGEWVVDLRNRRAFAAGPPQQWHDGARRLASCPVSDFGALGAISRSPSLTSAADWSG